MSRAKFLEAYADAILWANAYRENEDGDIVPAELSPSQIADPENRSLVVLEDANAFWDVERKFLHKMNKRYGADDAQHGHDFALTRNGHGAGFWDRGYGEAGDYLTKQAHAYGEANVWL